MQNGTGWAERFLNEEGKPEGGDPRQEERFFDSLATEIRAVVRHFAADNGRPMRGNHAKQLAGTRNAEFRVAAHLPADLSVGFLAPGRIFPQTILRFSNAGSEVAADDREPDLRGVAIRIATDSGPHDFLMTNAEVHHARDAREAMVAIVAGMVKDSLEDAIPGETVLDIAGKVGAGLHLVRRLGPGTAKRIAATLNSQMGPIASLAEETYWSRAPLAIGDVADPTRSVAVKYRLTPAGTGRSGSTPTADLGQELADRVAAEAIHFVFQVQRYLDPERTPIEDATVAWSSPWETIGELTIPQGTAVDDHTVDALTFNPWNVDPDHFRPLGSMNRSRRVVYQASVAEWK